MVTKYEKVSEKRKDKWNEREEIRKKEEEEEEGRRWRGEGRGKESERGRIPNDFQLS